MRIRIVTFLHQELWSRVTISINLKPVIINLENTIDFNRSVNFTRDLHLCVGKDSKNSSSFFILFISCYHCSQYDPFPLTYCNLQKRSPLSAFPPPPPTTIPHQFQTSHPTIDRCINPRKEKLKASSARTKIPPSPISFLRSSVSNSNKASTLPSIVSRPLIGG